jgi:hypothetical protein
MRRRKLGLGLGLGGALLTSIVALVYFHLATREPKSYRQITVGMSWQEANRILQDDGFGWGWGFLRHRDDVTVFEYDRQLDGVRVTLFVGADKKVIDKHLADLDPGSFWTRLFRRLTGHW